MGMRWFAVALFAGLQFGMPLGNGSVAWAFDAGERGGLTRQILSHLQTDAAPGMRCQLHAVLADSGEAQGVQFDCQGSRQISQFYTIEQLRRGIVLYREETLGFDVLTADAPNLDPVRGGWVRIHYLSNLLRGEYADWWAEIVTDGSRWTAYTNRSEGRRAFNYLFAAKRVVFGQIVGIREIQTSWNSKL